MKTTEHTGQILKYLSITPDNYNSEQKYPLVILLHGYGSHMGDLASICESINSEDYIYISPNAPIPIDFGIGSVGFAWSEIGEENHEEILIPFFQEIFDQFNVDMGHIALGGFSQGGIMTYKNGLTNPQLFRGLFILSGKMPNLDDPSTLLINKSQGIFIAHGTDDGIISVADARKAKKLLVNYGYSPKYSEYDMAHQITPEVLTDLKVWLNQILGS